MTASCTRAVYSTCTVPPQQNCSFLGIDPQARPCPVLQRQTPNGSVLYHVQHLRAHAPKEVILHPVEPPFLPPAGSSALPQKKPHTPAPPGVLTKILVNLRFRWSAAQQGVMGSFLFLAHHIHLRDTNLTTLFQTNYQRTKSQAPWTLVLDHFSNENVVITRSCHWLYHPSDWGLYFPHFSSLFHHSTS